MPQFRFTLNICLNWILINAHTFAKFPFSSFICKIIIHRVNHIRLKWRRCTFSSLCPCFLTLLAKPQQTEEFFNLRCNADIAVLSHLQCKKKNAFENHLRLIQIAMNRSRVKRQRAREAQWMGWKRIVNSILSNNNNSQCTASKIIKSEFFF